MIDNIVVHGPNEKWPIEQVVVFDGFGGKFSDVPLV